MELSAAVEASSVPPSTSPEHGFWFDHPLTTLVARRVVVGVTTLAVVSVIIFLATEVLPGNAANAILGHDATPQSLHTLEIRLHLNQSVPAQYWAWISGLLSGNPGTSLANGESVWHLVAPRLVNSAFLVVVAGLIGTILGVALGAIAALRKDSWYDHISSVWSLTITSLPEFVVAIGLVIMFATIVFHLLPGVSFIPPGTHAWQVPNLLILPIATLVIVVIPYIYRMMRAAMIEALESDYVELARLSGVPEWRIVLGHALPNSIAPTIQVIGINYLYLAGGIVIVESFFNFPGIGQGMVNAVTDRDIPTIQLIVLILAAFYIVVNITTDVIALLASPRRRVRR
jgi:peptide/nickel transport system permease protein